MDLNDLYHRRGKSLLMAPRASCERSRNPNLDLARGYVAHIAEIRRANVEAAA